MMNRLYYCYGGYSGCDKCQTCEVMDYCMDATKLDKSDWSEWHYDDMEAVIHRQGIKPTANEASDKSFSHHEVRVIMRYLLKLSKPELALISALAENTELDAVMKLSEVAKSMGISRQAVHRTVQHAVSEHPELAKVFIYRRRKR